MYVTCRRAAPVRAAVRTLTLNVYAVEEAGLQAFLAGPAAAPYFSDLGAYMTDRCQVLCLPHRSFCPREMGAARNLPCLLASYP